MTIWPGVRVGILGLLQTPWRVSQRQRRTQLYQWGVQLGMESFVEGTLPLAAGHDQCFNRFPLYVVTLPKL